MEHLGLAALAVLVAWLPAARARSLGGAGLAFVALAAAAARVGGSPAPASFTLVNRGLVAAGILLVAAAVVLRGRLGPAAPAPTGAPPPRPDPLLLAGLSGAAVLPGLVWVGLGAAIAIAAAGRMVLGARRPAWFVPLLAGAVLLGTAVALTVTILGPMGDRLDGIAAGPVSPAAERLLVMLYGGGALLLAGVPPLRRAPWGVSLAPLAAILLVRVMGPGFPGGLAEWQPLGFLVLGAGLVWSGLRCDWPATLAGGGLLVLWSGRPAAGLPGAVLVLTAWLLERFGAGIPGRWRGLPVVPAAVAGSAGLSALLGAEVVLPVATAVGIAVALALAALRRSA